MKTVRAITRTAALSTLLLTATAAVGQPDPAAAPRAVVDAAIVDVGNVAKGEPIRHDFALRNSGNAPLEITGVKPSCGCTVADYTRRIPAGGSGTVNVVVKTTDFAGPIAKSVAVFTNDPATPRIQLTVKANIRTEIEIRPGYARFVVVQGEEYEPTEHRLNSIDDRPFQVLDVTSPVPFLDVETTGSGSEWTVRLELDDDAPVGPIADFVVVSTDHPRQQEIRLPVSGFVRPPLVVIPQIFDFGRRKLEEPYSGKVQIKVVGADAVRLGAVTSDLEGVEAEIEESASDADAKGESEGERIYYLVIRLQPGLASGPAEGTVTVETDNERYPVLEIPIRGTVL